ncbi:MAG: glucose 1-dehydrogenase [Chloroflexi bacterium]|nr:glucose 1-dehydrogenase [Chloroflexota bacterium]MCC6892887.1 glucose 1-dehydrogenase [Anaerolineae bacterium]
MKFENRVALVTGGASGIGRAAAFALAAEGASVVISDIDTIQGEAAAQELITAGHQAMFVPCDVSRAVQVSSMVRRTVSSFGRLDCAVNSAGIGGDMTPTDLREEASWDRIMDINLKGVWLSMKYELEPMLNQSGGAIVNVSSAAGLTGLRHASAYSASKHGVIGLTRSAALEYARKNIRINAVCPGFTDTPLVDELNAANPKMVEATIQSIPMRRLGTPEEIAQAIVWLCSDNSSFVTGHALAIDGGRLAS